MISVANLHKSFGPKDVLRGISVDFNTSGITAILGPNASGKTTLIKTFLGMVIPDSGEVRFEGRPIRGEWAYKDRIDYLPQIARFPENLRVSELIQMIRSFRVRRSRADELVERFDLVSALDQKFGHLSGGTKQKVNLVVAFMYDNPLVILDEPSAGLDPVAMQEVRRLFQEEKDRGKIILLTTHIMGLVEELAERIVFLLDGNVHFQGTVDEIKSTNDSQSVEESIARLLRRQKSGYA